MRGWLTGLVVVPYEIIGLVISLVITLQLLLSGGRVNLADPRLSARMAGVVGAQRRSLLGWASNNLCSILVGLMFFTGWPPAVWSHLRNSQEDASRGVARRALRPLHVTQSLWSLFLCSLVVLSITLTGIHRYLVLLAWLLILCNMSRQISTILPGYESLQITLRRSLANPVAQLGLIALADFATLTLAAIIVLRWPAGTGFKWSWLPDESKQVVTLAHLSELWRLRFSPIGQLVVVCASLAVMALLVNQLKNPKKFRRDDSDRLQIGTTLLQFGDIPAAKRWLAPLLSKPNRDVQTVEAQGILALVTGDWDTALRQARLSAQLGYDVVDPSDATDDALGTIAVWARPFADRRDYMTTPELITFLVAYGISDGALATTFQRPDITKGAALYSSTEYTLEQAGVTSSRYPMTRAVIDRKDGLLYAAEDRLARVSPETVSNKLVWEMLKLDISIAKVVNVQTRLMAIRDASQLILDRAAAWNVDAFPHWLRQWLSAQIIRYQSMLQLTSDKSIADKLRQLRICLIGEEDAIRGEGYFKSLQDSERTQRSKL